MKFRAPVEDKVVKEALHWDSTKTPHFNENAIKDHVLGALASGANACFRFSKNSSSNYNSCHGLMHVSAIALGTGWLSSFRYKETVRTIDEMGSTDEAGVWYVTKFLLGKYSPWACLLPYLTIVKNNRGVPVVYILDGDENLKAVDKLLLQNFNIASRLPFEYPTFVRNMFELYRTGLVKKTEALYLSAMFAPNPYTKTIELPQRGYNFSFLHRKEALRFFERAPQSKMFDEKFSRFCPVWESMSSNNDAFVWGSCKRDQKKFQEYLNNLPKGSSQKTFFHESVNYITTDDFKKWLDGFRETLDTAIGKQEAKPTDKSLETPPGMLSNDWTAYKDRSDFSEYKPDGSDNDEDDDDEF